MGTRSMVLGACAVAVISVGAIVWYYCSLRRRQCQNSSDALLQFIVQTCVAFCGFRVFQGFVSRVLQAPGHDKQVAPSVEEQLEEPLVDAGKDGKRDVEREREASRRGSKQDLVVFADGHEHKPSESVLSLEVIYGPSTGLSISVNSVESSSSIISIGRSPNNRLVLNDFEVSSKHAIISWNSQVERWQLVDKGSLNGTFLNGISVGGNSRKEGRPVDLSDGDSITVGSSSRLRVEIVGKKKVDPPFPLLAAVASDPMTARKGGKSLPMEDVSLCEWPLRGLTEFGVFAIFDGHSGKAAALNASRIMPEKLSALLLDETRRESVLQEGNATSVLREAFHQTEEELPNEDEGCTATVLLVWRDASNFLVAQAANVGDSHCAFSVEGEIVMLTEDHRLTGHVERARLESCGVVLREGETRLWGMNIARVLGDKFLKAQGVGLSAEPYISQALQIGTGVGTIAVIASDGLWDVLSPKRALQLANEVKQTAKSNGSVRKVDEMATSLVSKARQSRTQDNTTVIIIDFEVS